MTKTFGLSASACADDAAATIARMTNATVADAERDTVSLSRWRPRLRPVVFWATLVCWNNSVSLQRLLHQIAFEFFPPLFSRLNVAYDQSGAKAQCDTSGDALPAGAKCERCDREWRHHGIPEPVVARGGEQETRQHKQDCIRDQGDVGDSCVHPTLRSWRGRTEKSDGHRPTLHRQANSSVISPLLSAKASVGTPRRLRAVA